SVTGRSAAVPAARARTGSRSPRRAARSRRSPAPPTAVGWNAPRPAPAAPRPRTERYLALGPIRPASLVRRYPPVQRSHPASGPSAGTVASVRVLVVANPRATSTTIRQRDVLV